MKKHLDLLIYLSIVCLFLLGLVLMNGCGNLLKGGGGGGFTLTNEISGALYGGTEEGKVMIYYASAPDALFLPGAGIVTAEMGANSYHISGLPTGIYFIAAWQEQKDNSPYPIPGNLIGFYGNVYGVPTPIIVGHNTINAGKDITLGCWTGIDTSNISIESAFTYVVSGEITGGTTEEYLMVVISRNFSTIYAKYVLKKPTGTNPAGKYYFTGVSKAGTINGTYLVAAYQHPGWAYDANNIYDPSSLTTGDYIGTAIATIEYNNVTANITLEVMP
ncbi:MAG: hypothetical protein NT030_01225 [Candidatus Saganbacteria bacterium]|nr:hypothetical protein [Candidatus Saganbacteria bacterium]